MVGRGSVRMISLFYSGSDRVCVGFVFHSDGQRLEWNHQAQQCNKAKQEVREEKTHVRRQRAEGADESHGGPGPADKRRGGVQK